LCHQYCDARSSAYMGLQYGHECWCSRRGTLDVVGDDGQCNITCAGDPDTTCGGYYAFDLYQLEWAEAPTSEEYVGCFADSKHDRVMFNMMVSQNMTETVCRDHCVNIPGTLYYATQYGTECFCGHSSNPVDYEIHGTGVCHMECGGDPSVACG
ncbi:unnamed protein product, partial [Sphacelaria rigidula]